MKYSTLLDKLVYDCKLTYKEYQQLINYVDNSQDWNMRDSFRMICEFRFGYTKHNKMAVQVLAYLIDNGLIFIEHDEKYLRRINE